MSKEEIVASEVLHILRHFKADVEQYVSSRILTPSKYEMPSSVYNIKTAAERRVFLLDLLVKQGLIHKSKLSYFKSTTFDL